VFSDLDLLLENVVSDFLSRLSQIRPLKKLQTVHYRDVMLTYLAKHALVCHNADRKIVDTHGVFLSAHDLRRHVPRCARGV
jgi:hypothetical protein